MNNDIYREYRFKFYLNANHFIVIDGQEGQRHPHTWEFMVNIAIDRREFVQFNDYEKAIERYFEKYQNRVMNEVPPFDRIVPTLENMAEYFVNEIKEIVQKLGGQLMQLECSETPTRSYVISLENQKDYMEHIRAEEQNKMADIIDSVLEDIL